MNANRVEIFGDNRWKSSTSLPIWWKHGNLGFRISTKISTFYLTDIPTQSIYHWKSLGYFREGSVRDVCVRANCNLTHARASAHKAFKKISSFHLTSKEAV